MPTSPRLRGNVLPIFTLAVGEQPAASYADDIKKISGEAKDKDSKDLTFWEAANASNAKDWTFKVTTVASFAATALYRYMWEHVGEEATLVWGPWGNAIPTEDKPHFRVNVTVPQPGLDTEASLDATGAAAEVEFASVGALVRVTA